MKTLLAILLAAVALPVWAVHHGRGVPISVTLQLLTQTRQAYTNWALSGLQSVGGIPAGALTTQCGSTLTPSGSDDTSAINTAIGSCGASSCPSGKYIQFGTGTFLINAAGNQVNLNKCIVLNGNGPGVTILHSSNGAVLNSQNNGVHSAAIILAGGSTTLGSTATLTSDGAQGAYTISVNTTTGFAAGDLLHIDELGIGQAMPDCCFNVAWFTGVITSASGTTAHLAISSASGSAIATGLLLYGTTVPVGTTIAAGSGTSWTITCPSACANVASEAMTANGTVWAESDYRVEWNQHNPTVAFWDSACAGYSNNNNFSASCATNGDECAYSIRCGGVTEELHLITAVDPVGKTITFDSPLTISYRVSNSAAVHDYPKSQIVTYAGIENMTLSNGDNGNLVFAACMYCWAHEVESTQWLNAGGFAFYAAAFRDQVDFSYTHDAAWPVNGGGGYATNFTYGASEDYFFNNIVMKANKMLVVRASGAGSVVAYNYFDDGYINGSDTWVENGLNCSHLAGSHHVLFEGNEAFNSDNDFTHGSTGHCTWFRNWLTGFRAPFTTLDGTAVNDFTGTPSGLGPQRALGDHAYSYWDSFVGNVVGTSGDMASWTLRCINAIGQGADGGCAPAVFNLGWNDSSVAGASGDATMALSYPTSPANTITGPGCLTSGEACTPILDGNYDYKSNSIQWASNDTTHLMPSSMYLTGKPSFFSAGSGNTWPWVTPEGSSPLQTGCFSTYVCLPAYERFIHGTPFAQP